MTLVKICGIKTREALDACREHRADFVGFTFVAGSPRAIGIDAATALRHAVPPLKTVALISDASDAEMDAIASAVAPDLWQCHGHESPARIATIKARYGLPIMKAFPIAATADLKPIDAYQEVIDWILLDAKPPAGATVTGGHSLRFDWALLAGWRARKPWLLAGGLTPENVRDAISRTQPTGVDVASGVEETRGEKSVAKIAAFLAQVRA